MPARGFFDGKKRRGGGILSKWPANRLFLMSRPRLSPKSLKKREDF